MEINLELFVEFELIYMADADVYYIAYLSFTWLLVQLVLTLSITHKIIFNLRIKWLVAGTIV